MKGHQTNDTINVHNSTTNGTGQWAKVASAHPRKRLRNGDNEGKGSEGKKTITTELDEGGYNSEDEHVRPRVMIQKVLDDLMLKHVDSNELAEKLDVKGLKILPVGKDGNCLFRSVAHQLYGDQEMHDVVRKQCLDYMEKERDHFSQFVTEDFTEYVNRKRHDTVYGNHLELQAIAEIYNRPILIYAKDEEPLNLFQEEYQTDNPPMRLSYHYGNHYNSVHDPNNPTFGVGFGLPGLDPGGADRQIVQQAIQESEDQSINQQIVQHTIKESEQQSLNQQILEEIKKNSESEDIEAQLLDAQLLETMKKESLSQVDNDLIENQYLELMDSELLEQVMRASWSDY